jgi:hypothetical protein
VSQAVNLAVARWLRWQVDWLLGQRKRLNRYHALFSLPRLIHQLRLLDCCQKVGLIQRELSGPQVGTLFRVGIQR